MNLLFVCTGNTCRSPAAEVLARAEADRRGLTDVVTASAGTQAFPDQPAASVSIAVAAGRGLDLTAHRSREFGLELVEWADHILVMTASHGAGVEHVVPGSPVRLLTEFLPDDHPQQGVGIADPWGGDVGVYEDTYTELEEALASLFDSLEEAGGDNGG